MNVMPQVCGIIVLITIIIFHLLQKKLSLRTEISFFLMLLIMLLVHVLDIFSLIAIKNSETISPIILNAACKAYLVSLQLVISSTFFYVSQDIFKSHRLLMRKTVPYAVAIAIAIIGVLVLPFEHHYDESGSYTSGPSVYLTYASVFLFVIVIIFRMVIYRKKINPDRRIAVLIWMGMWMLEAIIQLIFPSLLLASFTGSIGMMILYIKLENPGLSIDKQSGMFNQGALIEFIVQKYASETSFAAIMFQLDSEADRMRGIKFNWNNAVETLHAKNALLFRKTEYEGVLIFLEKDDAVQWQNEFFSELSRSRGTNAVCLKNALWASVYDSDLLTDHDELFYFARHFTAYRKTENEYGISNVIGDEKTLNDMRTEIGMEKLIEKAISENTVEVFYQPIYSTVEKRFTAAEALVRLRDENGKIVPPGVFIPIAEKTGKILGLGNAVFENVCRFISERRPCELGVDYIEVNLSAVQCSDKHLADTYIGIMEKYGVGSEQINLEITESAQLKRRDIFADNLEKLKAYGLSFSLDDFGTGHSNLNYIVEMPVDVVKFDRDMTNAFFVDEKARYVMEAAMQMIHGMGLKIVSEGIETKEQCEKIIEMGISYIQGYYFSKPVPENEYYDFVAKNNC